MVLGVLPMHQEDCRCNFQSGHMAWVADSTPGEGVKEQLIDVSISLSLCLKKKSIKNYFKIRGKGSKDVYGGIGTTTDSRPQNTHPVKFTEVSSHEPMKGEGGR